MEGGRYQTPGKGARSKEMAAVERIWNEELRALCLSEARAFRGANDSFAS